MPKRTKGEKLKYYTEKIRKLNEINNRRSIRRRIIQSESSDENSDVETQSQYNQNEGSLPRAVLIDDEIMERDIRMEAVDTPQVETGTPEVASHPELTFEYLQALGDAVDEVPQYGEEIHSNLAQSLDKSLLNVIENNHDETLFGANLSEKIKAAKIIEKQGLSIKKNVPVTKPSTSFLRPRPGNWTGPPRFPSNRGGRTAPRAATMTSVARRALAGNTPQPPSQARFSHPNRQRAFPTHRR
ncbi:unnamed protein product, partial [Brenthis ino]